MQHTLMVSPNRAAAEQLADTLCLLKEGAITTAMVQEDPQAASKLIPLIETLTRPAIKKAFN